MFYCVSYRPINFSSPFVLGFPSLTRGAGCTIHGSFLRGPCKNCPVTAGMQLSHLRIFEQSRVGCSTLAPSGKAEVTKEICWLFNTSTRCKSRRFGLHKTCPVEADMQLTDMRISEQSLAGCSTLAFSGKAEVTKETALSLSLPFRWRLVPWQSLSSRMPRDRPTLLCLCRRKGIAPFLFAFPSGYLRGGCIIIHQLLH